MRTFAERPRVSERTVPASFSLAGRAGSGRTLASDITPNAQGTMRNQETRQSRAINAEVPLDTRSEGRAPGVVHDFGSVLVHRQNRFPYFEGDRATAHRVDVLSEEEGVPEGPEIDQAVAPPPPAPAPAAAPAGPAAPVGLAEPTNLLQLLTSWAPGPNRYGFQLRFRCRSTSGDVTDLQNQAPNLIWREHVTYSRNDFSHRINPPNPTILPPGGVSFSPARTRRVATNLLEFSTARDTHWMPTTAVRSGDFQVAPPSVGFVGPPLPPLPAIMESRQRYQFSQNGGGTWRTLAGAFIIRRTLFNDAGNLRFRTQKTGVHTTTEPYKP